MLSFMQVSDRTKRLSQRVRMLKPSASLGVMARVGEMRAQGLDVVSFGAGEPDFDTPPAICQAAIDALRAGQTHYTPVAGPADAREAIARKLGRENAIDCKARDVVISCGVKHSIYLVLQCLLDPDRGQEVIVPTPAWLSYRPMIELAGGTVVEVPGSIDNDFRITPEQLEAAITPRTAALIVNSPINPCGTMYTPQELRDLAEVLERHEQVTVVTDEIYEKLVYGGIEHFSLGSVPSIADRVVTTNGLSKSFAMTGWRIGYAAAPGDDGALAGAIAKLQGQMTSNITSFCYAAIVEALERGSAEVERMRRSFAERAALVHGRITRMQGVRCPRPTGTFYVFPDVSAYLGRTTRGGRCVDSSVAFAGALLEEAHVAVVPGSEFGECGEGHMRLSFACSPKLIEEGCDRIDRWLRGLR